MADFQLSEQNSPIAFEDILNPVASNSTATGNEFTITNRSGGALEGYRVVFRGSDFVYGEGDEPVSGTVASIDIYDNNGDRIGSANGIGSDLGAVYQAFKTRGGLAALDTLFAAADTMIGTGTNDRLNSYGRVGDKMIGMNGSDLFILEDGTRDAILFGGNAEGGDVSTDVDTVEIRGNVAIRSMQDIDVVRFADGGPAAKSLQFQPFGFELITVQGSAAGTDSIVITGVSEAAQIDLSAVTFVNWSRANQTVNFVLNTDLTRSLDDNVRGTRVADSMSGGNGRDIFYGNAGNDTLDGGFDSDILDGGDGDDTLIAGEGINLLFGGLGNDTYYAGASDVISDGGGIDELRVKGSFDLANVTGIEKIGAQDLNATVAMTLTGNTGNNRLTGNAGKSTLIGNAGNDTLEGREGSDILNGGNGKDAFLFNTKAVKKSNIDTIVDFSVKDDTIQLDKAIFTGFKAAGGMKSSAFYAGSKSHDKDDRIIWDSASGKLFYDADGTGKAAAVQIAQLTKNLGLNHKDFMIL